MADAPDSPPDPRAPAPVPPADPLTGMARRFNLPHRWFARRFFSHFELGESAVRRIRGLEERGAVVYVMRYSSRLDYFLFNVLFLREGLRLSSFANGLHFYFFQPLHRALRLALFRPRGRPREIQRSEDLEKIEEVVRARGSLFLFLRTDRLRNFLRGRKRRPRHEELDLLTGVVKAVWDSGEPVSVVPLSVFWRKGPRSESRFLNLSYGSLTRPSDLLKVSSFLATYRSLSVQCGEAIDLSAFIAEQREEGEGPERVARKVRRTLLAYLYRQEKVVQGPALLGRQRVRDLVLSAPAVQEAIRQRAEGRRGGVPRATAEAERHFFEIAANMNSTFLAALDLAVSWIFRRMFASIEVEGLEKIASYARRHPIVLLPNHRSYFDFLILSWLFYRNFLVPPHIAARDNMAFGPFGFIFRRAGAFFLRRSFDDPLYKEVFRSYVAYLVREGFTQEFFIEGGRSRTGKTLAPRMGMLSWDVEAFLASRRQDLFFVPIAITYERLVEESAMVDELQGGAKSQESMMGLVRARKYLQRRFGSVHISFGEPVSLADSLAGRREELSREDEASAEARRRFVDGLGHRIVERINWAATANATSVAASVLLGVRHPGLRREDLVRRMQIVVDLLRLQDVRLTAALEADEGAFSEAIAFLLRSDLLKATETAEGEVLHYEESRRRALDMYRNSIAHFLAVPSILARSLLAGASEKRIREDLGIWQDLLYQEYFAPRGELLAAHGEALVDHFRSRHWVVEDDEGLRASPTGRPFLAFLAEQTRGVIEAYRCAFDVASDPELDLDTKAFLARAAEGFDQSRLLGEVHRMEAANDTTFQNAVDLMVRRGILIRRRVEERATKRGRRRVQSTHLAPGEGREALESLRRRFSDALSVGELC